MVGGAVLSMTLAAVFTAILGGFEGSAAMGGFTVGLPLGILLGAGLGLWLVLRKKGLGAKRVFIALVIAFLIVIALAVVTIYS